MMNQYTNVAPITQSNSYFGMAKVIDKEKEDGTVPLLWESEGKQQVVEAIVATYRPHGLKTGDKVLISGESVYQLFVVGIISKPAPAPIGQPSLDREIVTSTGVAATLNKVDDQELLNIHSSDGELLFSYDAKNNTTRVIIPKGDLQLATEEGNIELNSAKAVNISGQSVKLESKRLTIHAPYAKMIFGRLESVSDTIIEGAKNVFRDVKELTQTRTGRMRTFVDETYQMKCEKANIKAKHDYKVDADKIHLG